MNRDEMEEIKRHFGVVAEGLRTEIRQVSEDVAKLNEKLDGEFAGLRREMKSGFAEIKSMFRQSEDAF